MRKGIIIIGCVLLFATGAVIAQKLQQGTDAAAVGGESAMSDRPLMVGPGMAMGWMMMPRVVSTQSDGSVIVQTGSKLIKYDKDLNLKKEVMVPIDSETVQMMMHAMGRCMKQPEK